MTRPSQILIALGTPVCILGAVAGSAWLIDIKSTIVFGPTILASRPPASPPPPSRPEDTTILFNSFAGLTPEQAISRNAELPYAVAPLLTGARYDPRADDETPAEALQCLTQVIYYEAAEEPLESQRGVAQVVINRWASPIFPKTLCGVIKQGAPRPGCQFSSMCDGSTNRTPSRRSWNVSEAVAKAALDGSFAPEVGAATHYHADYVFPLWAPSLLKLVKYGHHIFYRLMRTPVYIYHTTTNPAAIQPSALASPDKIEPAIERSPNVSKAKSESLIPAPFSPPLSQSKSSDALVDQPTDATPSATTPPAVSLPAAPLVRRAQPENSLRRGPV